MLRIFQLYANGYSLKAICQILNSQGIPSPRARERGKYNSGIWGPTTLSGNPAMGEGILNNEIYCGRRIFNRRRWVEIPNENRGFSRRPRLNPESEWIVRDEPDLRIIDQELWDRVKSRQVEVRTARDDKFKINDNPLSGAKRPEHLLSGLVRCGVCSGSFVSTGGRWRCKAAMRQACPNGSITGGLLEERALAGLRSRLLTPEVIGRFAHHLQRELDVQQRTAHGRRDEIEAALAEARARAAKIVRRIEDDEDAPRFLTARLKELDTEEMRLEQERDGLPDRVVVRLPANYQAVYRAAVAELEQHLATMDAATSRNAVRALIEAVVVHAGDSRGGKVRRLELHGDLFQMLEFAAAAVGGGAHKHQKPRSGGTGALSVTPVVAGAEFQRCRTRFRLSDHLIVR